MKLTMNVSPQSGKRTCFDTFDILSKAGFDSVDFMLNDLVFDDSDMFLANTAEYCEKIRLGANKHGLTVEQTHAPFQFKNWDNEEHFESVIFPRIVRSLEMSALLGAKISVVHPLHHRVYKGHEQEIFELNMSFYKRLIPYCKEYGVKVGIENMWQRDKLRKCIVMDTCNSSEELKRYIDTLDSEYMVACLDLGHVGLALRDDEAQDFIRALGHDRLKALHVHDNDYQGDLHALPYLGKMNWVEITQALADINYDGDLTYEVSSSLLNTADDSFTPIGAKFMANVGRHLISEIERKKK